MDKKLWSVSELKNLPQEANSGVAFAGVFLTHKCSVKKSKNGSQYLNIDVGDATGAFSFNCFDNQPIYALLQSIKDGTVVLLEGTTERYNEKLSPKINHAQVLNPEQVEREHLWEKLIPCSLENSEQLWHEYEQFTQSIQHDALRATVQNVMAEIGDLFRIMPGAVMMHHAYRYGLMEHTVHGARAAKALLPLYPEVDADMAMTGILLHDVGKVLEYSGDRATQRTRLGILQGHVVLGYRIVRKAALQSKLDPERLERLEHIILSHQGELEWGAAVLACTPEALFVSMIDNFDAKMGMVQHNLRNPSLPDEFSEKIYGLNNIRLLVTSLNTDA